jgi:hypothetical protein
MCLMCVMIEGVGRLRAKCQDVWVGGVVWCGVVQSSVRALATNWPSRTAVDPHTHVADRPINLKHTKPSSIVLVILLNTSCTAV